MRPPIKSPIQMKANSPLFLVKLGADLLKVHKDFLAKVDEFIRESKSLKEYSDKIHAEAERIKNLPRGPKGDKGDPGPIARIPDMRGEPGKDAPPINLNQVAEMAARLVPRPADGEPGKAPSTDEIVRALIKTLKEKDHLGIEDKIGRVRNEVASYRNQLAGKVYGKDTWARGGGDTVGAGTNISIITNADGTKVISASGGGVSIETPTGTVNGVNDTFTPSAEPLYVIADGITSFAGAGYTWNGSEIVMDIAPSQFIRSAVTP